MFHGMISLKSVLLLLQFGIDVYIPHREYQVKPHSFSWFSGDCDAAVVHSGKGDGGGGAAKISYATKTKELITFGELLIVLSTKVNLLYLLNSTDRRCCLLHLTKQNYLLKTFLRTLILMTLGYLYQLSLQELI